MVRSIVVGTDGSPPSDAALQEAIDLARTQGAQLHIVAAYPDPARIREHIASTGRDLTPDLMLAAENLLARARERAEAAGVSVETHDSEADPADALLDVAKEQAADLIVVGDRGLRGVTRFLLGSVSSKVVQHAECSVQVVRKRA